jgi:predicted metal-dependent phosphoesterase TrpH
VIDLHMHTTASDGRCTPEELVQRVKAAGITTMAVTDHDTMAGVPGAAAAAQLAGLQLLPGIEITSVSAGKDVHVLGYFLDPQTPGLTELIADQRRRRVERAREIGERLARLGAPIDVDELVATAASMSGKAIARPQIAQALIAAGHVATVAEAFDRFLGETCGAYVPHTGASPESVVDLIRRGGGISSLAHPGYTKQDGIIPGLVEAGLASIEAYHSSHDDEMTARYLSVARQFNLAVSGGSDFHGEGTRRSEFFGKTHLPVEYFDYFLTRAGRTRASLAGSL